MPISSQEQPAIFVTDDGFNELPFFPSEQEILEINTGDNLVPFGHLNKQFSLIKVVFGSSNDGRGFSIARQLRAQGFEGLIVASGHVIADQYRHFRQCGFDGVLITAEQVDRTPQKHWLEQVPRIKHSYQNLILL